jgi:hypothetical protein
MEVRRRGKSDRAAGIGFRDAAAARGEIHQPAVAIRVPHDPWVTHRAIMPERRREIGVVGLRVRSFEVEAEPVADPRPVVEVVRGRVPDPLVLAVIGMGGAGVEQVPAVVVAAHHRSGPRRVIVPRRVRRRFETGAEVIPGPQVAARGMPVADVEMTQLRIAEGLQRLEEKAVPEVAVADVPRIPDPVIFEFQNHQPLTPVVAMDAMKARCRTR